VAGFWGQSGALWKYCSGALDLLLLYELRNWWNDQSNVVKISEQIFHGARVASGSESLFVTVRMVEAATKLPFDSRSLVDLTKDYLTFLVKRKEQNPAASLEQLLDRFSPSSDKLSRTTLQETYGDTPALLLVDASKLVDRVDPRGPLANLLKAVLDWAVYSNAKTVIQRGEIEFYTGGPTSPDAGTSTTILTTKPRRSFYIGFRSTE